MVTRGEHQVLDLALTQDRRVIPRAGPESYPAFDDLEFLGRRQRPPRAMEQAEHCAGGQTGVEAAFLGGRADNQPPI